MKNQMHKWAEEMFSIASRACSELRSGPDGMGSSDGQVISIPTASNIVAAFRVAGYHPRYESSCLCFIESKQESMAGILIESDASDEGAVIQFYDESTFALSADSF